jgi:prepilin-type N-terminal cleavage/methylation domain-containing protein/prepilin-type processing-associated H-X9-DG protein
MQTKRSMLAVRGRASFLNAFTLIELLVVIAVIAILAALILPTLGRAKDAGRSTACVNNMRQIGIACTLYSGETGHLPSFLEWLYPLKPVTTDLKQGQLYPYLKSQTVYLCPNEQNAPAGSSQADHSYKVNCMMCHARDTTTCFAPSRTLYFTEGTNLQASIAGGINSVIAPQYFVYNHNLRTHFLMADTHVEKMNLADATAAVSDKRFWYPTDRTDAGGNP